MSYFSILVSLTHILHHNETISNPHVDNLGHPRQLGGLQARRHPVSPRFHQIEDQPKEDLFP